MQSLSLVHLYPLCSYFLVFYFSPIYPIYLQTSASLLTSMSWWPNYHNITIQNILVEAYRGWEGGNFLERMLFGNLLSIYCLSFPFLRPTIFFFFSLSSVLALHSFLLLPLSSYPPQLTFPFLFFLSSVIDLHSFLLLPPSLHSFLLPPPVSSLLPSPPVL